MSLDPGSGYYNDRGVMGNPTACGPWRSSTLRRQLAICLTAGLVSGALVLGLGGRGLMRLLAFTTPEAPRFTWYGSLQVVASGAVWGALTGPLLLALRARRSARLVQGALFGLLVLALAIPPFFAFSGFRGTLVAPASFLWLSSVTFPALFALHGILVRLLYTRWTRWERHG